MKYNYFSIFQVSLTNMTVSLSAFLYMLTVQIQCNRYRTSELPTMLSRSCVACFSCFSDALIMSRVSVKVWHTSLLLSSFLTSFPSSALVLKLQFKVKVMPCSWAKSVPVESSSKENCFMKASRASETIKEIKPH